jgi:phosphatidylinositol-3-phosphatase
MRRVAVVLSVFTIGLFGLAVQAAPTFGATATTAQGEASCTISGHVKFSPGLKTAAQSVVVSVRASASCPIGATGAGKVTVTGATLKTTLPSASLSCASASLPASTATLTWKAKGGSVTRSTVAWSAGSLALGSNATLDFPGTGGTVAATGSYAGSDTYAHVVSSSGPGSACSSKSGWRGFSFARKNGLSTLVALSTPSTPACTGSGTAPAQYDSVVVFSFENRSWAQAGGVGFGNAMPYLHRLAQNCAYFSDFTEADTTQVSLQQYIGQVTGAPQPTTINDCNPGPSCSTTADNIFRQARVAGKTAINYVEGATSPCSASGNAPRHIPELYMFDPADVAACNAQVRPYSEFDPNNLPDFSFITPTLCNDGHDCPNPNVDAWALANIKPVLDSAAYQAGHVAVFVWYDEDHPVSNMWITPTATAGPLNTVGAGYAGELAAWEQMLGLPCLANACTAPDMRTPANS